MTRQHVEVAARCIIRRGEELLFQRGKEGVYRFPGGRLEYYENLPLCLTREMLEEIGVNVTVGRLYLVNENFYYRRGRLHHELVFYFMCSIPEGAEPRPMESHVKLEWKRPGEVLEAFRPRRVLEEIVRDIGRGFRSCKYIQTWGD
jgi:ADP-ribose pyrophosphatase YjhB (NUDIX family)